MALDIIEEKVDIIHNRKASIVNKEIEYYLSNKE